MTDSFADYDIDEMTRKQGIFASMFILENRLQTACEKLQAGMSMKQWLLLALTDSCHGEKTLTNIGRMMGCSRQNVKKLCTTLESKGYIKLMEGPNNSVLIEIQDKAREYAYKMGRTHMMGLQLIFQDFSPEEIEQLFALYVKLYCGIERLEKFAEKGMSNEEE